ncbi:MAG TPA: flagellar export chaperone FliS [Candidatus Limnocylindrales bacterium]|nr:flagellar export chaperone FliS [Candidatus Limnocylindrales bacterium]
MTMWHNAQDAYLESKVYAADGIELIRLLYQGCMSRVRDARTHLESGDIAGRARSISKACAIISELMASVDRERGGELGVRLVALYDYIQRKLVQANFEQADEPLAEVLGLLATLAEAWDGIQTQRPEAPVSPGPWTQAAAEPAYASSGWSF